MNNDVSTANKRKMTSIFERYLYFSGGTVSPDIVTVG